MRGENLGENYDARNGDLEIEPQSRLKVISYLL